MMRRVQLKKISAPFFHVDDVLEKGANVSARENQTYFVIFLVAVVSVHSQHKLVLEVEHNVQVLRVVQVVFSGHLGLTFQSSTLCTTKFFM